MANLVRLFDFVAGTLIKSSEVDGEFNQIINRLAGGVTDENFPASAGMYTAYRTIKEAVGLVPDSAGAADYALPLGGDIQREGVLINWPPAIHYLDPARYAIAGRTTKLSVTAQCYTNDTAPAITMTVGLVNVLSVAGAADQFTFSLGSFTAGSTVVFASPAAGSRNAGTSGDFSFSAADHYAIGVTLSGTPAAGSLPVITAQLQQHWV